MSDQPPTLDRIHQREQSRPTNDETDTTSETKQESSTSVTCPECESTVSTNHVKGERSCDECGLVLEEGTIDRGPEWRAFNKSERDEKSRVGPTRTELRHDRGMSATIDWKNKDAYGNSLSASKRAQMKRLRSWDKRAKRSGGDRGMAYANGEIMRMGSALGTPKSIQETAGALYRQCQETGLVPGRSIEAMATAVLYIALRVHEKPRSLDEVAQVSRVNRKPISRAHRYISQELELPLKPVDPKQYLPRFATDIGVSQEILRTAATFIEDIPGQYLSGCDPTVLAGSALYAASIVNGKLITQHSVKDAANVTEVSIRNNYKRFLIHVDSVELTEEEVNEIDSPISICREINGEVLYNQETRTNGSSNDETDRNTDSAKEKNQSMTSQSGDSNSKQSEMDSNTYSNAEYDFQCPECSNTFDSYKGLGIHIGVTHSTITDELTWSRESTAVKPIEDSNTKTKSANSRQSSKPNQYPGSDRFPHQDSEFTEYVSKTLDEISDTTIPPAVKQIAKILVLLEREDETIETDRNKESAVAGALYAAQTLFDTDTYTGVTQAEIADIIGVSTHTVSTHYTDYMTVFEKTENKSFMAHLLNKTKAEVTSSSSP